MFSPQERKVVGTTLTQRRAWLAKALEDKSLADATRKEHTETLKTLDSALKKLAGSVPAKAPASTKPAQADGTFKLKSFAEARVLIAEDDEASATLLIDFLADLGIKSVDHATDGWDAFGKIKNAEDPYHLILCDWDMPELSGIEVHNKAKASNTLRGARFMMVTGMTEAAKIKQAVQQGINDYIVKPIDVDILEQKISDTLGLKVEK